ncbi:hypothetical protein [Clostridium oceanicum]|uniref:Alkyl hydroperoxide reductase subunit C/ Thiol specific antioxidant domain-containing protein n=1 Tax=Clostridium oceanicum TaxID=1543 RepID=A0ABN1JBN4_9CLOT
MQAAYSEIKDKDFNIVGIVEDGKDNEDGVNKILSEKKVTYTNIIPDDKFYDDFVSLVGAFPTSILVNDKGEILKAKLPGKDVKQKRLSILTKQEILDIFKENSKK